MVELMCRDCWFWSDDRECLLYHVITYGTMTCRMRRKKHGRIS